MLEKIKSAKVPLKLVEFSLGEKLFGLDAEKVAEVVNAKNIMTVADSNDFVVGVVNVRGKIIPVGEIRPKLGIKTSPISLETRIIVFDGLFSGFLVDSAKNRLLDAKDWSPEISESVGAIALCGTIELEDRQVFVFDSESVFSETEKNALENVLKNF